MQDKLDGWFSEGSHPARGHDRPHGDSGEGQPSPRIGPGGRGAPLGPAGPRRPRVSGTHGSGKVGNQNLAINVHKL